MRRFNIDNTSTFYDINAVQDAKNKEIFKRHNFGFGSQYEMYKDGYRDCQRLDDIVCKIKMYNYDCELIHNPFIIRTFGVETNDNQFHVEKVRFMLDYIKSFKCKMFICTLDIGMLLNGLKTTKYAIKRLIKEDRINIYFTGLGFCLDSSTIDIGGLFVDEDSVI